MGGHFHTAPPAIGSKEHHAVWIGHLGPVDLERVVVKTFVKWSRVANPGAVLTFDKFCTVAKRCLDALRFRSHDPKLDSPLRIDLRITTSRLIRGSRLEVVRDSF